MKKKYCLVSIPLPINLFICFQFILLGGVGALQEYMADVEVRAAHNVLEACAQTETIDKVVFTSSVTAVIWREDHGSMDSDFDETHWSNINLCRKYKVKIDQ